MQLRWGILSAGRICNDFVIALSTLPSEEHRVVSVAARELQSAKSFAEKHKIEKYYEGYDSLLNDTDVDIVYIGAANHLHHEWTIKCLTAGKHVLCEKPLALNAKQVKEMIEAAAKSNRFLMEALWSRFSPAILEIQNQIAKDAIGEPRFITAEFGLNVSSLLTPVFRELKYGGGSIYTMAVYPINLSCLFYGDVQPIKVHAVSSKFAEGTDSTTCITLEFPGSKFAQLTSSFDLQLGNEISIYGSKGFLTAASIIYFPTKIITPEGHKDFPLPKSDAVLNYPYSSGLIYEASHVRQCIIGGKLESPLMPLNTSLMVCNIMDEIRRQIGVVFPQD